VIVSSGLSVLGGYYRALAHLPGAAAVASGVGLNIQPARALAGGGVAEVAADGRLWHQVDIPKVLAGRMPRADRAGEIAVDQKGGALHLRVGNTLTMVALPNVPPRWQEALPGILSWPSVLSASCHTVNGGSGHNSTKSRSSTHRRPLASSRRPPWR
jgi:hypothetical protein